MAQVIFFLASILSQTVSSTLQWDPPPLLFFSLPLSPGPSKWRLGHPPLVEAGDTNAVRVLAPVLVSGMEGWGIGLARVSRGQVRTRKDGRNKKMGGLGVVTSPCPVARTAPAPPSPTPFPVATGVEKQIVLLLRTIASLFAPPSSCKGII